MGTAHLSTPLAWGRINSSLSPEPLRPLQGDCTTRGLPAGHLAPHDHLTSHTAQYRSDVRTQVLRPLLHPNTTHRTPAPSPRGPTARLQGVRLRCPGHSPEGAPHARSRRRPPRPPTPPSRAAPAPLPTKPCLDHRRPAPTPGASESRGSAVRKVEASPTRAPPRPGVAAGTAQRRRTTAARPRNGPRKSLPRLPGRRRRSRRRRPRDLVLPPAAGRQSGGFLALPEVRARRGPRALATACGPARLEMQEDEICRCSGTWVHRSWDRIRLQLDEHVRAHVGGRNPSSVDDSADRCKPSNSFSNNTHFVGLLMEHLPKLVTHLDVKNTDVLRCI